MDSIHIKDLSNKVRENKKKIMRMRVKLSSGGEVAQKDFKNVRKTIAQLLTEINLINK